MGSIYLSLNIAPSRLAYVCSSIVFHVVVRKTHHADVSSILRTHFERKLLLVPTSEPPNLLAFLLLNRSPRLGSLSGCAALFIALVTVCRYMLASDDAESTGEIDGILLIPMMPTLFTGPYILRGVRLLVLYNPPMRKRWGAFAREPVLLRAMVISCVVLEVINWTAVLIFGIERSGDPYLQTSKCIRTRFIGACARTV